MKWKGLTEQQGAELLIQRLHKIEIPAINRLIKVPLTQNQFDAIVRFTYNVGVGGIGRGSKPGLTRSMFLQELNQGNYNGTLMMRYHTPSEIIERRQAECVLFNYGIYQY